MSTVHLQRLVAARDLLSEQANSKISLRLAADEAYLSAFHFHRLFKKTFGVTPLQFQMSRRFELAKEALLHTEHDVAMIALSCGYESPSTFVRCFRERTGMTPGEYRRQVRHSFAMGWIWSTKFIPSCWTSGPHLLPGFTSEQDRTIAPVV